MLLYLINTPFSSIFRLNLKSASHSLSGLGSWDLNKCRESSRLMPTNLQASLYLSKQVNEAFLAKFCHNSGYAQFLSQIPIVSNDLGLFMATLPELRLISLIIYVMCSSWYLAHVPIAIKFFTQIIVSITNPTLPILELTRSS